MKAVKAITNKRILRLKKNYKREINACVHTLIGGLFGLAISSAAIARPQNGVVTDGSLGSGGIAYGNRTTIDQKGAGGTQKVTIRWNSFDTTRNESVHFKQRADQTAINRILGNRYGIGGNTIFNGGLTGAGNIILINQNGFLFGKNSQIRVGSFMATTNGANIPKNLSKFQTWVNKHKKADRYATIINDGKITITKNDSFALLVAPYVENNGTIKSGDGVDNVTIGLGSIGVDKKTKGKIKGIKNTGTLRARSGYVAMVNAIFNASVNVGGILDADQFGSNGKGGAILVASKGDIKLKGAKFSARGGRDVEVRLKAEDDILSKGKKVTTFKLSADDADAKMVKANLDMEAGGKIKILTDASVIAQGSNAAAEFDVEGKQGVTITTGDKTILVKANAVGTKSSKGEAIADADLDIDSKGNIKVNGHVIVKANAEAQGKGGALAGAELEVGKESKADNITINGNVDVVAGASTSSRNPYSRIRAAAISDIVANGKNGNVKYVGDLNVKATSKGANSRSFAGTYLEADGKINTLGDVSVVAKGNSSAEAEFDVEGKRGVTITTGDETILVKANAFGNRRDRRGAYADADLDIDSKGDIEVNGHVVVKANARGRGRTLANADVEIGHEWKTDKIKINGDVDVVARANTYGRSRRSSASANAYNSIVADGKDGDITFVGDLNVKAKSLGKNSMSMAGGLLLSSGDIDYTGDLNIKARSKGKRSMALAGGGLLSSGDISYTGDTKVTAKAKSYGRRSDATSAAGLAMLAGLNIGGNRKDGWISPATLTKNGDVLVEAKANSFGPGASSMALGLGILAAGGDVNINTDPVIVNSIAKSKGRKSRAASLAGLITVAGLDSFEAAIRGDEIVPYDLNIIGDHEANAIAKAARDRRETALAANVLLASGNITVRGADPLASANDALVQGKTTMFEACGDGNIGCLGGPGLNFEALLATLIPRAWYPSWALGNGYAQLVIEAGGTVDIQPKAEPEPEPEPGSAPNELLTLRLQDKPFGTTGNRPLSFSANGDMIAATGFGVTQPPPIKVAEVKNIDVEAALLAGADPSTLLPPTAAGGEPTNINQEDTMTTSAVPDFCDRLVSGSCYDTE